MAHDVQRSKVGLVWPMAWAISMMLCMDGMAQAGGLSTDVVSVVRMTEASGLGVGPAGSVHVPVLGCC